MIEYGDGFPLLFQFIKYLISLFCVMFLFQGVAYIVLVIVYFATGDRNREVNFTNIVSINIIVHSESDINDELALAYELIALFNTLVLILWTAAFWIRQIKYRNKLDENIKTDGDFAILMSNLPNDITKTQIREILYRVDGIDDSRIIYINRAYKFDHILKLKKKQLNWLEKLQYLHNYRELKREEGHEDWQNAYPKTRLVSKPPCKPFPREEKIHENLQEIEEELEKEENQKVQYCGMCIVVFKTEYDAQRVIDFFEVSRRMWFTLKVIDTILCCCKVNPAKKPKYMIGENRIFVRRAPEPRDIIWENLARTSKTKYVLKTILIYSIVLAMLVPIFFLLGKNFILEVR